MITLIILLVVCCVGLYLLLYKDDYEGLGILSLIFGGFFLLTHLLFYLHARYNYELFVEKRNAFEQTLNESRESSNKYENAAIVKEVAAWNQELAKSKYQNKTIFFDQYIDDRIESLEPIK